MCFITMVRIILIFQDLGLVHSTFRSYNGMHVVCVCVSLHGLSTACSCVHAAIVHELLDGGVNVMKTQGMKKKIVFP